MSIGPAQLQECYDLTGQKRQAVELLRGKAAGTVIDHTQRSQRQPVTADQRNASVGTNRGFARHQRVVGVQRIPDRVRHDKEPFIGNRITAERIVSTRLTDLQTVNGLEPLPVDIDQADQCDGRIAQQCGEAADRVVLRFGSGVEYVIGAQRLDTVALVRVQADDRSPIKPRSGQPRRSGDHVAARSPSTGEHQT